MRIHLHRRPVPVAALLGLAALVLACPLLAQPGIGVSPVICVPEVGETFIPLALNKTAEPGSVYPGDFFSYAVGLFEINGYNIEASLDALNLTLTDQLPAEALFQTLDAVPLDLDCTTPTVGTSGLIDCASDGMGGGGMDEGLAYTVRAALNAPPGTIYNQVTFSAFLGAANVTLEESPYYQGPLNCSGNVTAPVQILQRGPAIPTAGERGLVVLAVLTALAGLAFLLRRR